jgi:hypothetical protein
MLGDGAAHRAADHMGAFDAELVHQAERGVGQIGGAGRIVDRRAIAGARIVEGDDAVLTPQRVDLRQPRRVVAGETVDQDNGISVAVFDVVDVKAACIDDRHDISPP